MTSDSELSGFSVAPVPHTGLFGAFVAVHAVADALNVLHTGVGCKGKTQRQLVDHDLGREAHPAVGWTELSENDLIKDVGGALRRAAPELQERRRAALLLITASTAVEFTGTDLAAEARRLETELGVPVLWIPGAAAAPDLYAGYGAVVRALIERVDWSAPAASTPTVSLVGYLFHRYEHEHSASLAELRRLVELLGARLGPTFLAGEPLDALRRAHEAKLLVALPRAAPGDLDRLTSRAVAAAGLPLGVRATSAWLRAVARGLDLEPAQVDRLVAREEAKVAPRLALVRRPLRRRRVAIVGDTEWAAGWTLLARELDLEVALVALTDRSLGGAQAFRARVAAVGETLSETTRLVERPTLRELRALGGEPGAPLAARPFALAIRPDLSLAGTGWEDVPTVETGFPAPHKHFVYPFPELGYAGALALAQRVLDAVGGVH